MLPAQRSDENFKRQCVYRSAARQQLYHTQKGIVAFGFGTAGGVLLAKLMNLFLKEKINPLIGSAGVSAVPMAARGSQGVGQKEKPGNYLLMHAMGPNVAGVIGSAIAAGGMTSMPFSIALRQNCSTTSSA